MRPRLHRLNSHCKANNQFLASNLQKLTSSHTSLRRINQFLRKQPYSNRLDQETISQIILRNPSRIMVSYTFDSKLRKQRDFQNQSDCFQMRQSKCVTDIKKALFHMVQSNFSCKPSFKNQ